MGKLQVMVVSSLRLELRPVHVDKAPALLPLRNLWLPYATSYPFTIYDHVEETAEFATLVQAFFILFSHFILHSVYHSYHFPFSVLVHFHQRQSLFGS